MSRRNSDEDTRGSERKGAASGEEAELVRSAVQKVRTGRIGVVTVDELMALRTQDPTLAKGVERAMRGGAERDVVWAVERYIPAIRTDLSRGLLRTTPRSSGPTYTFSRIMSVHSTALEASVAGILCLLEAGPMSGDRNELIDGLINASVITSESEASELLWSTLHQFIQYNAGRRDVIFRVSSYRVGEADRDCRDRARRILGGEISIRAGSFVESALNAIGETDKLKPEIEEVQEEATDEAQDADDNQCPICSRRTHALFQSEAHGDYVCGYCLTDSLNSPETDDGSASSNPDDDLRRLEREFESDPEAAGVLERYMEARLRAGMTDIPVGVVNELFKRAVRAHRPWIAKPGDENAQAELRRYREIAEQPLLVSVEDMLSGYIEAALWSAPEEDVYRGRSRDDVAQESIDKSRADVELFALVCDADLKECGFSDDSRHGHDLLLTRNRTGTGFWDRDYDEALADRLTEFAQQLGEVNALLGDDGKVYFE